MASVEPAATEKSSIDRIVRIASRTLDAPVGIATIRKKAKLKVSGTYGVHLDDLDARWSICDVVGREQRVYFLKGPELRRNFKAHPLLLAAPFITSLVHIPVPRNQHGTTGAITIGNPGLKWPFDANAMAIISDLAILASSAIDLAYQFDEEITQGPGIIPRGLCECGPMMGRLHVERDPAGAFLLSTLPVANLIRTRRDVAYWTLRRWSPPVKAHQIKALRVVKQGPQRAFVDAVAGEFAASIRKVIGVNRIDAVTAVPCGHSKPPHCLSEAIGVQLAQTFGVPFVDAFKSKHRQGTSHPRKNPELEPAQLQLEQRFGTVLLVDDVATTGRHIQLTVDQLRGKADHVIAMAWIGAK